LLLVAKKGVRGSLNTPKHEAQTMMTALRLRLIWFEEYLVAITAVGDRADCGKEVSDDGFGLAAGLSVVTIRY
jgi:hypothetical protein